MLTMKVTYMVELTQQEFRLVSTALRGTLREEWKEEALALQKRLFDERSKLAASQLANLAKLSKDGL